MSLFFVADNIRGFFVADNPRGFFIADNTRVFFIADNPRGSASPKKNYGTNTAPW